MRRGELEAKCLKAGRDGRRLQVEFKAEGGVDKILVVDNIMLAILNLELKNLNETLSYPILLHKA